MKNLKAKLQKKGGFTLIEMLIVVAIIAILIAISIPLVNSALENARKATDAANERAAKAEATIIYLSDDATNKAVRDQLIGSTGATYDAENGVFLTSADAPTNVYGKCTDHSGSHIIAKVDATTGKVTITWANSKAAHGLGTT